MRINEVESEFEIVKKLEEFRKYFQAGLRVTYENGEYSVIGSCDAKVTVENELPFKFKSIDGTFRCAERNLLSLKGSPSSVSGSFNVRDNMIESLKYGPEIVEEDYRITGNNILSLDYLPKRCAGFRVDYHPNLELLRFFKIEDLQTISLFCDHTYHPTTQIINSVLDNTSLNKQQKILLAKRELIRNGYEGNAKL